jgi:hypothetical protein
MSQLYQMTIRASGEVRDSDGNLVSSTPIEAVTEMTEEQVRAFLEGKK